MLPSFNILLSHVQIQLGQRFGHIIVPYFALYLCNGLNFLDFRQKRSNRSPCFPLFFLILLEFWDNSPRIPIDFLYADPVGILRIAFVDVQTGE
jgi:hypothetical protein